jgi:hypothetical protein
MHQDSGKCGNHSVQKERERGLKLASSPSPSQARKWAVKNDGPARAISPLPAPTTRPRQPILPSCRSRPRRGRSHTTARRLRLETPRKKPPAARRSARSPSSAWRLTQPFASILSIHPPMRCRRPNPTTAWRLPAPPHRLHGLVPLYHRASNLRHA